MKTILHLELLIFSVAPHREKKPVFCPKIYHVTKISPNFLEFGLEVLYEVLCYAKEAGSHWWTLGFAAGCVLGSIYGFLQGAWPFGVVELIWTVVSFRRWLKMRPASVHGAEPLA